MLNTRPIFFRLIALTSLVLFTCPQAWGCVGCGQESYTPKMLLVGSLFAILPISLVTGIWWMIKKESRGQDS